MIVTFLEVYRLISGLINLTDSRSQVCQNHKVLIVGLYCSLNIVYCSLNIVRLLQTLKKIRQHNMLCMTGVHLWVDH